MNGRCQAHVRRIHILARLQQERDDRHHEHTEVERELKSVKNDVKLLEQQLKDAISATTDLGMELADNRQAMVEMTKEHVQVEQQLEQLRAERETEREATRARPPRKVHETRVL